LKFRENEKILFPTRLYLILLFKTESLFLAILALSPTRTGDPSYLLEKGLFLLPCTEFIHNLHVPLFVDGTAPMHPASSF
jgi:hypothetical protein